MYILRKRQESVVITHSVEEDKGQRVTCQGSMLKWHWSDCWIVKILEQSEVPTQLKGGVVLGAHSDGLRRHAEVGQLCWGEEEERGESLAYFIIIIFVRNSNN